MNFPFINGVPNLIKNYIFVSVKLSLFFIVVSNCPRCKICDKVMVLSLQNMLLLWFGVVVVLDNTAQQTTNHLSERKIDLANRRSPLLNYCFNTWLNRHTPSGCVCCKTKYQLQPRGQTKKWKWKFKCNQNHQYHQSMAVPWRGFVSYWHRGKYLLAPQSGALNCL